MGLRISRRFLPNHNVFPISRISIRIFVTSSKLGRFSSNKIHEHTNEAVSTNSENSKAQIEGKRSDIEFSNGHPFSNPARGFYKGDPCSLTTHTHPQ